MTNRFSNAGLGTASFALLMGSAVLLVPFAPVQAAPQERPRAATAYTKMTGDPETTSSVSKAPADEQPACDRARRRLWIEGEGWVVRRVATCQLTQN